MITSVVITFSTSESGYKKIAQGSLLEPASGENAGYHSCLVEGYDLPGDIMWVKNSWGALGDPNHQFRWATRWRALSKPSHIRVFFTLDSIQGKSYCKYVNCKYFLWNTPPEDVRTLNGKPIPPLRCIFLDPQTAIYDSDLICFPVANSPSAFNGKNWIGYNVHDWIRYWSNRHPLSADEYLASSPCTLR